MCGHCGVLGPGINNWDLEVVRDLLTVSTLRGIDSTGVLQGKSNVMYNKEVRTDYTIEKMANEANFFKWYHKRHPDGNKRILESTADNFICCHVRAATKGAITDDNAHPFEFENIIGMHNGTLRDKKYEHAEKTDSEMFFKDINENGLIPVLEKLDPDSAYAIVVFDKNTGMLHFARNDDRPLFFAVHATRSVMYYASEAWMLRQMMARNTEKMLEDQVYYFQPFRVYSILPQDVKSKSEGIFHIEHYKPRKKHTQVISRAGYGQGWNALREHQMHMSPQQGPLQARTLEARIKKFEKREERRKLREEKKVISANKGGKLQSQQQLFLGKPDKITFNTKTKLPDYWCCSCHKQMSLVDVHYGHNINSKAFVCRECFDEDFPLHSNRKPEDIIVN